jgi:hypothetical protein
MSTTGWPYASGIGAPSLVDGASLAMADKGRESTTTWVLAARERLGVRTDMGLDEDLPVRGRACGDLARFFAAASYAALASLTNLL